MPRRVLQVMAALVLSALTACGWFGAGVGDPCEVTSDCTATLRCDAGICIDPLRGTCIRSGSGETCLSNDACCSGICLSVDDQCHDSCTTDTDCGSGCCAELNGGARACFFDFECDASPASFP